MINTSKQFQVSIKETCVPPHSIANLAQIPPLKRPSSPFQHREGRHRRTPPGYDLVRWKHLILIPVLVASDFLELVGGLPQPSRDHWDIDRRRLVADLPGWHGERVLGLGLGDRGDHPGGGRRGGGGGGGGGRGEGRLPLEERRASSRWRRILVLLGKGSKDAEAPVQRAAEGGAGGGGEGAMARIGVRVLGPGGAGLVGLVGGGPEDLVLVELDTGGAVGVGRGEEAEKALGARGPLVAEALHRDRWSSPAR